jgi:hypothetical protein
MLTPHKCLNVGIDQSNFNVSTPMVAGWNLGEPSMTTLQAVVFGAMLAWTPSLMILAASLWDVREVDGME